MFCYIFYNGSKYYSNIILNRTIFAKNKFTSKLDETFMLVLGRGYFDTRKIDEEEPRNEKKKV